MTQKYASQLFSYDHFFAGKQFLNLDTFFKYFEFLVNCAIDDDVAQGQCEDYRQILLYFIGITFHTILEICLE